MTSFAAEARLWNIILIAALTDDIRLRMLSVGQLDDGPPQVCLPAIMATLRSRPPQASDPVGRHGIYAALLSAAAMAVIGMLGWWFGRPWLFPSLGPTIFIQTVTPNAPAARLWNTLTGHAVGIAAAFAAVFLLGADRAPEAMSIGSSPTIVRVAATAIAVGLTIALQFAAKAQHPPAAATTMLIALGSFQADLTTLAVLAVGIALVAGLGEVARRFHPAAEG